MTPNQLLWTEHTMLRPGEVAEALNLHLNTVLRLGDRGELPFYRVCSRGDRRYRWGDVMVYLDRMGRR